MNEPGMEPTDGRDASISAEQARRMLSTQIERWERVNAVNERLDEAGRENHFSDRIVEAMRGF